ncbi:MAG: DUF2865 domain-containing protein [Hyphomicrobiaceae bacterium]|nr:DUF2865 domain-containing protein [Hyphomicrobiaceae bacterium]
MWQRVPASIVARLLGGLVRRPGLAATMAVALSVGWVAVNLDRALNAEVRRADPPRLMAVSRVSTPLLQPAEPTRTGVARPPAALPVSTPSDERAPGEVEGDVQTAPLQRPDFERWDYWQQRRDEKRELAARRQAGVDASLRTALSRGPETGYRAFSTVWGGRPDTEAGASGSEASRSTLPSGRLAFRTVCVRMCDGYFVPVSARTSSDGFARDAALCAASCAAPARLYVYPQPGGVPEDMETPDGEPYVALPTAFSYRAGYDEACSCRPQPWTREASAQHRAYARVSPDSEAPVPTAEAAASTAPAVAAAVAAAHTARPPAPAANQPADLAAPSAELFARLARLSEHPDVAAVEPLLRPKPVTRKRGRVRPAVIESQAIADGYPFAIPTFAAAPSQRPSPRVTTNDLVRRSVAGRY